MTTTTSCDIIVTMTTNRISKHRATFLLDKDLVKQAKAQAIIEGRSLTDLVEKALIKCLPDETVFRKSEIK